jgi:hypothetical protein
MTNYYVATTGSNANNGLTVGTPFATILRASQVAGPGDVINVASGNYAGGFTTGLSGTAGARVRYQSTVKYGAVILGGNYFAGWENAGYYVDIDGFEINGQGSSGTSQRIGLYNQGGETNISNCYVHDVLTNATAYANAVASGNGGAGITNDNSNAIGSVFNSTVDACRVYNIGQPGQTDSEVHGFYQVTSGWIKNSISSSISSCGIQAWHGAKNIDFFNNTVNGARNTGIFVGSGDSGADSTTGNFIRVANNVVSNCDRAIVEGGTFVGPNNLFTNNLTFNSTTANYQMQVSGHTNDLTTDPLYVNAGTQDFHIQTGSPAKDSGSATYAPNHDFDNNVRPQGATPDRGAYEYVVAGAPARKLFLRRQR